jgi:ribosomal protein L35
MYQFKTNREEQWAKLEKRHILEGNSKETIRKEKNTFLMALTAIGEVKVRII